MSRDHLAINNILKLEIVGFWRDLPEKSRIWLKESILSGFSHIHVAHTCLSFTSIFLILNFMKELHKFDERIAWIPDDRLLSYSIFSDGSSFSPLYFFNTLSLGFKSGKVFVFQFCSGSARTVYLYGVQNCDYIRFGLKKRLQLKLNFVIDVTQLLDILKLVHFWEQLNPKCVHSSYSAW